MDFIFSGIYFFYLTYLMTPVPQDNQECIYTIERIFELPEQLEVEFYPN